MATLTSELHEHTFYEHMIPASRTLGPHRGNNLRDLGRVICRRSSVIMPPFSRPRVLLIKAGCGSRLLRGLYMNVMVDEHFEDSTRIYDYVFAVNKVVGEQTKWTE